MLDELLIPASFVLAIDQASKNLVLARFGQAKTFAIFGRMEAAATASPEHDNRVGLIHDRRTVLVVLGFASLGAFALIFHAPV